MSDRCCTRALYCLSSSVRPFSSSVARSKTQRFGLTAAGGSESRGSVASQHGRRRRGPRRVRSSPPQRRATLGGCPRETTGEAARDPEASARALLRRLLRTSRLRKKRVRERRSGCCWRSRARALRCPAGIPGSGPSPERRPPEGARRSEAPSSRCRPSSARPRERGGATSSFTGLAWRGTTRSSRPKRHRRTNHLRARTR